MALKIRKMSSIHVDEGVYTAVVASVQKAEGKFGDYISWSFLIKGAVSDGDPIEQAVKITGRTSATFNEKSKLYSWARACGLDVDTDEIDIEQALRKAVRVVVEDKEGNSGETISIIKKIMPLKKAKKEESEDEDDAPPPKAKKSKKPDPEEEEDEDDAPPPKAKKAKKPDPEEDEDEEPAPRKSKKSSKKEEDEDDEDEAPPAKKKAKKEDDDLDDLLDFDDED